MKKKVLVLLALMLSVMLTTSVSDVMARAGGSGEGDDCQDVPGMKYVDVGKPYKGTLKGWIGSDGKLKLCTPHGPLTRGGKKGCTMEIPCDNPYVFGAFPLPENRGDMIGWCRWGFNAYDTCEYDAMVSGYESICTDKPKYHDDGSFTVEIKIIPLALVPME